MEALSYEILTVLGGESGVAGGAGVPLAHGGGAGAHVPVVAEVRALVAAGAVPGGQLGHRVVHVGVGACRVASSSVGFDLNIVYSNSIHT